MKRIFLSLTSLVVAFSIASSCDMLGDLIGDAAQDEDKENVGDGSGEGEEDNVGGVPDKEEPLLEVTSELLPLPSNACDGEFSFFTNCEWRLVPDPDIDWLNFEITEGEAGHHTIFFYLLENTDYDERNAKFTICYGGRESDFVFYQNQKDAIVISQSKVEVPVDGGVFDITVDSNIEVSVANSDSDWLHQIQTKGLVSNVYTFRADPSELPESRHAQIFVSYLDMQEIVDVYQAGEEVFVLSEKSFVVPSSASEIKIDVRSNMNFDFTVSQPWISELRTRSISSVTKAFSIEENPDHDAREAQIVFTTSKGRCDTVTVIQAQKDAIVLAQTQYDMPSAGGLLEFNVASNVDFDVECQADWISRVQTRGLSDRLVSFEVQSNDVENSTPRQALITFSKGSISQQVTVNQAASSRRSLHVAQAGSLKTLITKDELKTLTELTITGNMNQDDVDMLTAGYGMFNGDGYVRIVDAYVDDSYRIRKLDLSGVTFEDNTIDGFILTNLEEVILPESLEVLGPHAFEYCWKLKEIDLASLPALHSILAEGSTSSLFRTMHIDGAFKGCLLLENVTVPSTVTRFVSGAFSDCTSLAEIKFSEPSAIETFELSYSVENNGLGMVGGSPAPRVYYGLFEGCTSLRSFTIPSSVTRLQQYTFKTCPVESIVIPETVHIVEGTGLFQGCSHLRTVTLPSYVTEISDDMFNGCSSLETINMESPVRTVGNRAFKGCTGLSSFDFASMIEIGESAFEATGIESFDAPANMTEIPKGLFMNCLNLKSVDLADVTTLGYRAFYGCTALTEVTIPETIEEIESSAFCYCSSLNKVNFEGENVMFRHTANHPPFTGTALKELIIPAKVRTAYAPRQFPTVEKVTFEPGSVCESYGFNTPLISGISLPSGLKKLDDYTFRDCKNLKSIVLPDGLQSIGRFCFDGSAVESLVLPSSLEELGPEALAGMSLKTFTVPSTVKHIRQGCFYNCTALEELNLPSSLESFGIPDPDYPYTSYKVLENTLLTELVLHGKNLLLGNSICPQYLRKLTVGNDVETITTIVWNETNEWIDESYSPLKGSNIYEIEYESGSVLKSIEGLYNNSAVQTVDNLPSSLKRIGRNTFDHCPNLIKVVIPEGVTYLGDYCFNSCTKLKEVVFPESLVEFGRNCFTGCTSLPDDFPLPVSLTTAGIGTFSGCTFKSMTIPDGWTAIPANLFAGTGIMSVTIPQTVVEIGKEAFYNCKALESVALNKVRTIGESAFRYCTALKSVSLPESCERIDYMTFAGCSSLEDISMPAVKVIEESAFIDCTSLTDIALSNTLETLGEGALNNTGIRQLYLNGAETLYAEITDCEIEKITISKNIKHLDGSLRMTGVAGPGYNEETGEGFNLIVEFEKESQLETFSYFFDNSYIEEIRLPASITTIDHGTFTGSTLKRLYMEATVPPDLNGVFRPDSFYYGEFRIYVPQGSEDLYRTSDIWAEEYPDIIFPYTL